MDVLEEVIRKKSTVKTKNWRKAHTQIKDLLEQKFDFSQVYEEKYVHHEERNMMYLEIYCVSSLDKYTKLKLEIDLEVDIEGEGGNVTISIITTLQTIYPENTPFRKSLFYFALRAMWDKIYYGWARSKYKNYAVELTGQVNERIIEFLRTMK